MHRHLNQKPVLWILLELKAVEERLCLLQETKRTLVLLMRYEVNGRVVELVQDNRHFVFIQVKLLAVELLERVLFLTVDVDGTL